MSTITPTGDQTQFLDVTTFQIGDTVQSRVDGRIGVIVTPPGTTPTSIPASPSTERVDVSWEDGSESVVLLSTLERV